MRIAIFPGSFDPFTIGHADIVARGLALFDQLIIAVGYNPQKKGWIPVQERVQAIQALYQGEPRISVESFSCLTIDFAKQHQANYILRGIRSVKDYEYELNIADINRQLSSIESVFLTAKPELASISSSTVRELASFGHEIQSFLPQGIQYSIL